MGPNTSDDQYFKAVVDHTLQSTIQKVLLWLFRAFCILQMRGSEVGRKQGRIQGRILLVQCAR